MPDLTRATSPAVGRARRDVLVVPTGSVEQHGPHLPLDTDTRVARAVARRVHEARPGSGLAPALPYGASGEHAGFPGTLSIGTEALATVVVELVRDATRDWGAVLVVNGHGGNAEALARAAAVCAHEGRRLGVVHLGVPGMDAHAGRAETSLVLHLDPGAVDLAAAVAGPTDPVADLLPALREGGVAAVSANGVLGDPAGAGSAEGERLLAALTDRALAAYDDLVGPGAARPAAGPATADPGLR
jgi:creatinine amidohydrolase